MKKNYFLLLALVLHLSGLYCQQLPLFNIYRDHWNVLNPASISNNYILNKCHNSIGVSYRQQWLKVDEGPTTQLINAEIIPVGYDRIVTGGYILKDQTGKLENIGAYGQFAYRLRLDGRFTRLKESPELVIGISGGLVQPWQISGGGITLNESDEPLPETNQKWYPDFSVGVFYYYGMKFYAGFSIPQVISMNRYISAQSTGFSGPRVPHYYAIVGGYLPVSWFGISESMLEPSVWVRHVPGSPISLDANLRYSVKDNFWFGLGMGIGLGSLVSSATRLETGVLFGESLGLTNSQFKIGFAFSFLEFAGNINQNNFNSLGVGGEVNLIYAWGK